MKAIKITTPCSLDKLVVTDIPKPVIGPRQVLVKWHARSLNFHDYLVVSGMKPVELQEIIPMSDGAGEVVAVGASVTEWRVGDKVMSLFFPDWLQAKATPAQVANIPGDSCNGYAAEYSAVNACSLTAIPEGYSYIEAATLPCAGLTAWRSLVDDCQIKIGDKVLIEGTGGFSIFALQFAKAAGATVFATSSSQPKLDRMKAMGADVLVNYKEQADWGRVIYELSEGGVDHALDVGGGSTLSQSIEACRIGGNVSSVGILGGFTAEVNFSQMLNKQIHVMAVMVGNKPMQEAMVAAINASGIRPIVDKVFALEDLSAAFEYQLAGKHFGKIAVEY
jgi:NADPH:quinone reductase-like Zn-dependent oxidoreductase